MNLIPNIPKPLQQAASETARRQLDPNGDGICPHCQQTLPHLDEYVPHKLDFIAGALVALVPAFLVYAAGFSKFIAMTVYLFALYGGVKHYVDKGRRDFNARNRSRHP